VSALFAGKSHLGGTVDLMEIAAALLGALIVLIAGTIWRSRTLGRRKQVAIATVPTTGIDQP
jgi:hypothetical protein